MGQRQNSTSSILQVQRATFLPMLCSRPSIKNVTIPKSQSLPLKDQDDEEEEEEEDPLSPKISCIGQVKRNNKITSLSSIHTNNNNKLAITNTTKHNTHYFKLKRLFSGKSLATVTLSKPALPMNPNSNTTPTRGGRRRRRTSEEGLSQKNKGFVVDVVNMDPPLPVVQRKQDGGDKAAPENLWKRRSGGLELRNLQIQEIQNRTHYHHHHHQIQIQLVSTI